MNSTQPKTSNQECRVFSDGTMLAAILMCLLMAFVMPAEASPNQPSVDDKHTQLLFHLDGNPNDSSACANHGGEKGNVEYVQGVFGEALQLSGDGGIVVPDSGSLEVGDNSWMIQCWIRPNPDQPLHAWIITGGLVPNWGYGIRISNGRYLRAMFPGNGTNASMSSDVSSILFDGRWHQVTALLDRKRAGEIRVYLDGVEVEYTEKGSRIDPIVTENSTMGLTVGAVAPWYIGKDGFRGAIDEIVISRTIREPFSKPPVARIPVENLRISGGDAVPQGSSPSAQTGTTSSSSTQPASPITLDPMKAFIVVPNPAYSYENKAAVLLQKWLRRAYRRESGFDIVMSDMAPGGADKCRIRIGRASQVPSSQLSGRSRYQFVVKRTGQDIQIAGKTSYGTFYGAVRFLDVVCGIRFYMPGDLFTSLPATSSITVGDLDVSAEPSVEYVMMTGLNSTEEQEWADKNACLRRFGESHSHNMYRMFPPDRFAQQYLEIYPVLGGGRYIPSSPSDQNWQPCFSEPKIVDVAEQVAIEFFRKNPQWDYIPFGMQDSWKFCECDRCRAGIAEKGGDMSRGHSSIFFDFVKNLAGRLSISLPANDLDSDKTIVFISQYGWIRTPPDSKLPSSTMHVHVDKISDMPMNDLLDFMDPRLTLDKNRPSGWLAQMVAQLGDMPDGDKSVWEGCDQWSYAMPRFGWHDWMHGAGYYIPRIYTGKLSLYTKVSKKQNLTYFHGEAYPNWGLDAIKLYITSRLLWDPDPDVKSTWEQFCKDMFPESSPDMLAYFQSSERLYTLLNNKVERKLQEWKKQLSLQDDVQRESLLACRRYLDKALSVAKGEEERKRIELLSKTFRLTEYLIEIANASAVSASQVQTVKQYINDVIIPDPLTVYRQGATPELKAAYVKDFTDKAIDAITVGKIQ